MIKPALMAFHVYLGPDRCPKAVSFSDRPPQSSMFATGKVINSPLAEFQVYIDADSCPRAVKELVFRASIKRRFPVVLVANRMIESPNTRWIRVVVVPSGPDQADDRIVELLSPGDLVLTGDIPLAARVLEKRGLAIDHRGKEFTESNIRERLAMRDFSAQLREAGIDTGGPKALDAKNKAAFANALDRCLTRMFNDAQAT